MNDKIHPCTTFDGWIATTSNNDYLYGGTNQSVTRRHCYRPDKEIESFAPAGIILSGGPESVHAGDALSAPDAVFDLGCPVLGICYGMQELAHVFGGKVVKGLKHEYGKAMVHRAENCNSILL